MRTPSLRQSMARIHGWMGLIAGWILFAMFLTGTASYFRPEITRWMQPEVRATPATPSVAAGSAFAYLQRTAPHAAQWTLYLPDQRTIATRVFVRDGDVAKAKPRAKRGPRREVRLDPVQGTPLHARDTRGGEHFYRFHFQLQLPHPWGRWLAGACAMCMLGAILSGVITHKRIFVDFFTLRWGKGQRSWLDAHNVSAVVALPFHAMITYTGLVTLMVMYMPWPIAANYAKPAMFASEAVGAAPEAPRSGTSAPLTPVAPLVAAATHAWDGSPPAQIVVTNPNDANARITLFRTATDRLSARGGPITFSGVDGHRIASAPPPGPAARTAAVLLGLHLGWFADTGLRWIFFLLGASGAAMVGTGLILWSKKRVEVRSGMWGQRLVERLNVAVIACLPAGMAGYLLANRLLPADLPARADLEVSAMFYTWFGLALLGCLRPARRAWRESFAIAGTAWAAIPVVNALTTDRGLPHALAAGDRLFASFDLACLALAALLFFAACKTGKAARRASTSPGRRAEAQKALAHAG